MMNRKAAFLLAMILCCAVNAYAVTLLAAMQEPAAAAPAAEPLSGQLGSQLATAAVMSWVIQKLKASGWFKWITPESSAKAQQVLSGILAVAATAGIHFVFDRSGSAAGTYVITITGLTASNALHFSWDAFQQYIWQHMVYHNGIKGNVAQWDNVNRRAAPTSTN